MKRHSCLHLQQFLENESSALCNAGKITIKSNLKYLISSVYFFFKICINHYVPIKSTNKMKPPSTTKLILGTASLQVGSSSNWCFIYVSSFCNKIRKVGSTHFLLMPALLCTAFENKKAQYFFFLKKDISTGNKQLPTHRHKIA